MTEKERLLIRIGVLLKGTKKYEFLTLPVNETVSLLKDVQRYLKGVNANEKRAETENNPGC